MPEQNRYVHPWPSANIRIEFDNYSDLVATDISFTRSQKKLTCQLPLQFAFLNSIYVNHIECNQDIQYHVSDLIKGQQRQTEDSAGLRLKTGPWFSDIECQSAFPPNWSFGFLFPAAELIYKKYSEQLVFDLQYQNANQDILFYNQLQSPVEAWWVNVKIDPIQITFYQNTKSFYSIQKEVINRMTVELPAKTHHYSIEYNVRQNLRVGVFYHADIQSDFSDIYYEDRKVGSIIYDFQSDAKGIWVEHVFFKTPLVIKYAYRTLIFPELQLIESVDNEIFSGLLYARNTTYKNFQLNIHQLQFEFDSWLDTQVKWMFGLADSGFELYRYETPLGIKHLIFQEIKKNMHPLISCLEVSKIYPLTPSTFFHVRISQTIPSHFLIKLDQNKQYAWGGFWGSVSCRLFF